MQRLLCVSNNDKEAGETLAVNNRIGLRRTGQDENRSGLDKTEVPQSVITVRYWRVSKSRKATSQLDFNSKYPTMEVAYVRHLYSFPVQQAYIAVF